MIESLGNIDQLDPAAKWLQVPGTYHFKYIHNATYLAPGEMVLLNIWVDVQEGCRCLLSDRNAEGDTFDEIADELKRDPIDLLTPLSLEPVNIEKPWGQEIWYTGIEARGVSTVNKVPLSWLLDVFGEFLKVPSTPLLLKILDPHPQENLGDLYFEMHEHKVEVYVVTHIDESAWPDGIGKIRYGFSEARQQAFDSTDEFLESYLDAVKRYESLRNTIDQQVIDMKLADGFSKESALTPAMYTSYLDRIPRSQRQQERAQRAEMYDYTAMIDLTPGDVVRVRPLTPHSLQHGVRVVEFQTPHYERYILSFGQQVLTQDHWDSDVLKEKLNQTVDNPLNSSSEDIIADFDEFKVERVTLEPEQSVTIQQSGYCIIMGVQGTTHLNGQAFSLNLSPEQAHLIKAGAEFSISNKKGSRSSLLIAYEAT